MSLDENVSHLNARVAKLERQVEFLLKHFELDYVDKPGAGVSPRVFEMVQMGDKIGAIKAYREETGVDLKTAKDVIDSLG